MPNSYGDAIALLDPFGVPGRLKVNLGDGIGRAILGGSYEPEETAFFRKHVRPGDVVLDIGANIGLFSIMAAQLVGPSGRVYAMEALPENVRSIRESLAENHGLHNVIVNQALVADTPRDDLEIAFQPLEEQDQTNPNAHRGGSFIVRKGEALPAHLHRMPIMASRLDDMIPAQPRVSFIKIDIEGAEMLAMRGASRILSQDAPLVLSEVHPQQLAQVSQCSWQDYFTFMARHGYEPREISQGEIGGPARIDNEHAVYNFAFVPSTR